MMCVLVHKEVENMFQIIYNMMSFSNQEPKRSDTALAFFQLSRVLSAGVSLSGALNDLASIDGPGRSQRVWKRIALSVSSGKSLSDAIDATPIAKDRMIIALLRAGEAGGELHAACDSIYHYLEWHMGLRQRLYTLLIYPLFSLGVLVIVVGFLFVSVVPSMRGFLLSSGSVPEWHTLALIGLSSWFAQYYLVALFAIGGVAFFVVIVLVSSPGVRVVWDTWMLKIPLLGKLIVDLTLSRYSRCCAQLYTNGVMLESSMELAEGTVMNESLRADLSNARTAITQGATLAQAIRDVPIVPRLFARLVEVGEATGELAEVLVQIGEHQSSAAEVSIKRMEQMIGPLLLMSVGAMLLWIVISILGPVYNMAIATVVGVS